MITKITGGVLVLKDSLKEANLYLDVYPNCQNALEYFYTARDRADYIKKEYEEKYGPLTANSNMGN